MNEVLTALKRGAAFGNSGLTLSPRHSLMKSWKRPLCGKRYGSSKTIILCLTDPDVIARLSRANAQIAGYKEGTDPFYGALAVLVVLSPKEVPTALYDGSLVLGNLMTAAHALGLGSR